MGHLKNAQALLVHHLTPLSIHRNLNMLLDPSPQFPFTSLPGKQLSCSIYAPLLFLVVSLPKPISAEWNMWKLSSHWHWFDCAPKVALDWAVLSTNLTNIFTSIGNFSSFWTFSSRSYSFLTPTFLWPGKRGWSCSTCHGKGGVPLRTRTSECGDYALSMIQT